MPGDILEKEDGCSSEVGRESSGCLVFDYEVAAAGKGEATPWAVQEEPEPATRGSSLTTERRRKATSTLLETNSAAPSNAVGGVAAGKMTEQQSSVGSVPPASAAPITGGPGGGGGGKGSKQSLVYTFAKWGGAACGRSAGAAAAAEAASVKSFAAARTLAAGGNAASGSPVAAALEGNAAFTEDHAASEAQISALSDDMESLETKEEGTSALNGDVPAWQREAQRQPLVGPKESLTALLRDFKGSKMQYAKARTFLVRLRGVQQQQQQQWRDTGACSAARRAAAKGGRCESGSSSSSSPCHHSSTVHNGSSLHSSDCVDCTPKLSSKSSGGPGRINSQKSDDRSYPGKPEGEGNSRSASTAAVAVKEKQRGAVEEGEEDEVLQEVEGGPCMRRVRGDGCCFYRGYMFGLLLYFLRHRDKIKDFIKRINEEFRPEIRKVGYDMDTVTDFSQEMIDSLEQVEAASAKDPTSEEIVEEIFNEVSRSNYIVVFARLLVSTHMKLNSELYLPFLTSYSTVEEFCKHEVDPMWVAAEQLQINALTAMTQVPVEIIYFDRSPGVNPTHHVFPESQKPQIHLLYRPGHYDILSI